MAASLTAADWCRRAGPDAPSAGGLSSGSTVRLTGAGAEAHAAHVWQSAIDGIASLHGSISACAATAGAWVLHANISSALQRRKYRTPVALTNMATRFSSGFSVGTGCVCRHACRCSYGTVNIDSEGTAMRRSGSDPVADTNMIGSWPTILATNEKGRIALDIERGLRGWHETSGMH